ncbi:MAG TPA: bifunctional 4-hydroxy-2-oxoglutarate aldolase/2-dehydro-3-deoxy-phosphogluconate aldolase [Fontimonas sp.]
MNARELLGLSPVMPVLVIDDPAHAVPLARALVAGGVRVLEVTLRTTTALAAIRAIAEQVPEAVVGAGTILTVDDLAAARDAGAQFGISPGATAALLRAGLIQGWPYLPGAATASEVMTGRDAGYSTLKFFPAEAAGGTALLKSLAGPLPDIRFCPTGGITPESARRYLALPNVGCVGGSWLAPPELLARGDWDGIRRLAAAAAALRDG